MLNPRLAGLLLTPTLIACAARTVEMNPPPEAASVDRAILVHMDEFDRIDEARREQLERLGNAVREQVESAGACELTFICTHNSRRSHMAQIWAQTAADHFGIEGVRTYSGGTEATAFNPRAVAALCRAGFSVESNEAETNPVYAVTGGPLRLTQSCFSKTFGDAANPTEGFIAVMTCSSADEACPFVPGAAARVAIPYEDPKAFDGTERETEAYDERCRQIAREMLFAFQSAALR